MLIAISGLKVDFDNIYKFNKLIIPKSLISSILISPIPETNQYNWRVLYYLQIFKQILPYTIFKKGSYIRNFDLFLPEKNINSRNSGNQTFFLL